ncbi:auxin-responsive protein SAUR32-like [Macadamia integrifolia]|uniref:auxin-responsive protein SAUR32-like n=1 Tax=Macadamia integrifolia TaxID=60698 RepID=UPI001C52A2B4|nr:auxin-responsive protein SAUR32-like [Macadamia integrifolia]
MGKGHKHLLKFHPQLSHHHHGKKDQKTIIPKGYLAIMVGQGEEQERFVIPLIYINHPLFSQLLKEAEQEYGFNQEGNITIPCQVEEFRYVQGIIDKEKFSQHHHRRRRQQLWYRSYFRLPVVGCFRA